MNKKIKSLVLLSLAIVPLLTGCKKNEYHKEEDDKVYKLNYTDISVSLESTFQLVLSLNGIETTATWSSNNDNVTVFEGYVTGNKIGESTVTATTDGLSFDCHVVVTLSENVPQLIINASDTLVLEVSDTFTLVPSLLFGGVTSSVDNIDYELNGNSIDITKNQDCSLIIDTMFTGNSELILKTIWHEITLYKELTIEVK